VKSSHRAICHLGKKRKMKPVDATTRAVVDECVITRLEKATMVATMDGRRALFVGSVATRAC
jgi:hypothetical protein